MSRVIEILDSDDDVAIQEEQQATDLPPSESGQSHLEPSNVETQIAGDVANISTDALQSAEFVLEDMLTSEPTAATTASSAPDSPSKTRSRHRRKSVHQPMRASPEMQFETISLDDEDDDRHPEAGALSGQQSNSATKIKTFKTMPKILTAKPPTTEELLQAAFDEFLATEEANSAMRQIAEERVRINFLLASYGMPDINFSLYTQYDRLKFQFEDRLKQRKMRSWMTGQNNKTKKRRTPQANPQITV